ncbi:hypothetical protein, partial [Stenotrophomonas sp.]|uniref:hypothetical protein n=1 Tax=Stenotrophomonas sp. TaxID=69392 RepID=UPI0028ACF906
RAKSQEPRAKSQEPRAKSDSRLRGNDDLGGFRGKPLSQQSRARLSSDVLGMSLLPIFSAAKQHDLPSGQHATATFTC